MKIVTYNIQYALGKDLKYDLGRIVDAVRTADIIALQEVERNHGPEEQSQPEIIASLLPDYYWVYDAASDIDGSTKDNSGRVINCRKQHGQMILSRWPIHTKRYFLLPRRRLDHVFNMQLGVLEGLIDAPNAPLRIYTAHFGSEDSKERQEQAGYLRRLVQEAPSRGGAWTGPANIGTDRDWSGGLKLLSMPENAVILGDFNMEPDSPEHRLLVEENVQDGTSGFVDARLHEDREVDTWHPLANRADGTTDSMRLDYCFVTSGLSKRIDASWVDCDAQGSDHQPVWLSLKTSNLPG